MDKIIKSFSDQLAQILALLASIDAKLGAPSAAPPAPAATAVAIPAPPPPAPPVEAPVVVTRADVGKALLEIGKNDFDKAAAIIKPFQADPPIAPGPYPNLANIKPEDYPAVLKAIQTAPKAVAATAESLLA